MAVYYDCGRFEYHDDSALFHLEVAAECGCLSAVQIMAKLCLGLPHDLLPDVKLEVHFLVVLEQETFVCINNEAVDSSFESIVYLYVSCLRRNHDFFVLNFCCIQNLR